MFIKLTMKNGNPYLLDITTVESFEEIIKENKGGEETKITFKDLHKGGCLVKESVYWIDNEIRIG